MTKQDMDITDMFIEFISGQNTVLVQSSEDFNAFIQMLCYHKAERILGTRPRNIDGSNKLPIEYEFWTKLSVINGHNPDILVFEYQPGRGISIYYDIKTPTDWYGKCPMKIRESICA